MLADSALSLGLLYWLIVAAGRAPYAELWPQEPWMRWLVNLAMPLAVLAAATGGMAGLMAAFTLWAGAHLLHTLAALALCERTQQPQAAH